MRTGHSNVLCSPSAPQFLQTVFVGFEAFASEAASLSSSQYLTIPAYRDGCNERRQGATFGLYTYPPVIAIVQVLDVVLVVGTLGRRHLERAGVCIIPILRNRNMGRQE